MSKERVEFEAHKEVKRPTNVAFTTKSGQTVHFVSNKPVKIPIHVSFTANNTKKRK
jgi:hypothetical protein